MTKAAAAAKKFLDEVREKADQKAEEASRQPGHGNPEPKPMRDATTDRLLPGHPPTPGGGRPPGSPNKVPRSIKAVMLRLAEGSLFLEQDKEAFWEKVARALAKGMNGKLVSAEIAGQWGVSTRYVSGTLAIMAGSAPAKPGSADSGT